MAKKTLAQLITPTSLIDVLKAKDFKTFDGEWDINIIGIRHKDTRANMFNDRLAVLFKHGDAWQLMQFDATTDPGVYWRNHPANIDGTAIVVPGQYRSVWKIGNHHGKPALVQNTPIAVYRDNDKNQTIDTNNADIQSGYFGINCHQAGNTRKSKIVDKWSAGCQVIADTIDFDLFMALCRKSAHKMGCQSFTYTLLLQSELEQ